ncbi:MAG: nucleotide kinase, partial [Thermoplasmata archaeon]|nr:nucleotide kinase [Thermoplasmata archaeon]
MKIGITGLPGSGKTQTLLRIIQLLEQEGIRVGGMVTEPIEDKHRRAGFQITNWLTKEHEVFAHEELKSRVRSGRYGVNL